jgi:hypothetical protein
VRHQLGRLQPLRIDVVQRDGAVARRFQGEDIGQQAALEHHAAGPDHGDTDHRTTSADRLRAIGAACA